MALTTEDLRDIIAAIPREQRDPMFVGVRASYRFEIEEGGTWLLRIAGGRLEISEGGGEADTVFYCTAEDFKDVILGEQNLITAVLQGRIDLGGDLADFFVFHQLLKSRQAARRAQGATP